MSRLARHRTALAAVAALILAVRVLWPAPPGVVVQGVLVGSMSALLALGVVLVYRANRIVNFAQGDLGAVPATVALLLMVRGWNYLLAIVAGLVLALCLGALVQRVLIARFGSAPRLILTVVTIGLSQVLAALGAVLPNLLHGDNFNFGSMPAPFEVSFTIDPIVFRGNDVLAMIVAPFVIAALAGFLRYSSIGMAIRATAENLERAALLGVNVGGVQITVWMVAVALSATGVFLRASALGFGAASSVVLMTRALAAAVIGRMENFGVVLAASIGLGILEQAIVWDTGKSLDATAVTFAILIGALLLQRRGTSRLDESESSTWKNVAMPREVPSELAGLREVVWARRAFLTAVTGIAVAVPWILSPGQTSLAALVLVYAILGISLVILTGWAGQVSLGHAALFGVGGAVGAALTISHQLDLTLVLLAGGFAGMIAAVVVGLPALRIRGLFLAVSTLAFSVFTSSWLLNPDVVSWVPFSNDFVERRPVFGRIDITAERPYYYVCLAVLLAAIGMVAGLRTSRIGRVLIALRDNERATQAFGVNATTAKLTAFAASGFFAAVGGVLYVHSQQALGSAPYSPGESLRVFTMVVIGGMASVPGAIVGSLYLNGTKWLVDLLPNETYLRTTFSFLGTGVGAIVVLWLLPGGLGSALFAIRDRLLRRVATRHAIDVPSLTADRAASADVAAPPVAAVAVPEDALLRTERLEVGYDGVQVLFGVDMHIRDGEILALLGTNGAGKSTLLRAITGLTPATAGLVSFAGEDLTNRSPTEIVARGIGLVPGGRGVFPSLTVKENLQLATWRFRRDAARAKAATEDAIRRFPVLGEKLDVRAGDLSGGQQQMLTLAQTFMSHPRLLVIDELSLGLAPVVVEQLIGAVRAMRDEGTTVVLVEQSVNVALTIADRAYFMEKGEIRFEGPTEELLDRPDILRAVFIRGDDGSEPVSARTASTAAAEPRVVLEVEGLTKSFGGVRAVDDVSFAVEAGKVLGIIGANGAGKTTVFDLISGFTAADAGGVVVNGIDLSGAGPHVRAGAGLARSFQDARLFPALTVWETIAVSLEICHVSRDPLAAALHLPVARYNERGVRARVEELVELLGLGAFRHKFTGELSTGTRRIVDLACVLAQEPTVLLLDEPSSGVAQRETEALAPLLRQIQAETGASMLIIEHDMPLITAVSDELLAMETGACVTRGPASEVLSHPRVVASYLGEDESVISRSGAGAGAPRRRRKLVVDGR